MNKAGFRRLCAGMKRSSVGQMRALRGQLRALDTRIEVLSRIDARGQALTECVHCAARCSAGARPERGCKGRDARPVVGHSPRPPGRCWSAFVGPRSYARCCVTRCRQAPAHAEPRRDVWSWTRRPSGVGARASSRCSSGLVRAN